MPNTLDTSRSNSEDFFENKLQIFLKISEYGAVNSHNKQTKNNQDYGDMESIAFDIAETLSDPNDCRDTWKILALSKLNDLSMIGISCHFITIVEK